MDGRKVTESILQVLQLEANEFRLGATKVFFRAGVLGQLEDIRDERLGKIIAMFQAWIRGYLMRRQYRRLQDQRHVPPASTILCLCHSLALYYSTVHALVYSRHPFSRTLGWHSP